MTPRSLPCRMAMVLLCAATCAHAGTVRGTLRVPAARAAAAPGSAYPGRAASMPGMRMLVRGAADDAVISIARLPAAADSALRRSGAHPRLVQRDQAFVPRVLPIAVGTTVDFPNQDPIYHNVFSVSPTRRFDLGKYPKGQFRSVTFTKTGLVNVYCDIHSDMAAYIIVLPNTAFAQPAEDGSFQLPPLPAGTYTVHVWHPDLGEFDREVRVPAEGAVTLELAY